jgi:hypothetical protein
MGKGFLMTALSISRLIGANTAPSATPLPVEERAPVASNSRDDRPTAKISTMTSFPSAPFVMNMWATIVPACLAKVIDTCEPSCTQ